MAEHDHPPRESTDGSIYQISDLVPVDGSSFRPPNAGQQTANPNVFSDDYSIDYSPDSPVFSHRRSLSLRSTNSSSTIGPRRSDGAAASSDHNMQLMLLEQQNKRRLLMARQQLGQSTSRLSLAQSNVSTPGDEITPDPFADQPTSSHSQNDVDRRSSIRKDVTTFHRRSALSTTSTRSGYHDIPREMSPYQGATGPSHPYGMYPQIGVSRSASVATASTTRPDAPLQGPTAPSHPYGMYPQNIDYEEDIGDRPIPMGFPANGITNSQESTHADEVGDIVGPDGHLEQLPPYTRYPDGIVRRAGRGPASIASAMREPRQSYHDEPVSRSDVSSRTLVNAESSQPLRPSIERSSRSSTLIPFDEKLRQRGQRRCCGAPLWLLALLGLGVLIGGLIGGVIGGVLGERAAERRSREAAAARHSATAISQPPPSPAVVTITETTDVSPYSVTPTGIPNLPTGKYQIPWTVKNTSKFCIGGSNELQAWSCHVFDPLSIQVMGSIEQGSMSIDSPSFDNSHFSYGAQLPYDISPPQQELRMMKDKDDVDFGPALYFTTLFNKLVIVEEQQISMSKRSVDGDLLDNGWVQQSNSASPGDKPWYCWWNQTQIEIFIYVNETQGEGTAPTTSPAAPGATAPQSTTTSGPQKRSLFGRKDVIPENYPRRTKIKENRVIPNAPQAYCQQMQVNPDNSITPIPNNLVEINESKSNSGSSKRDKIYARGDYQSPCYCEWLNT